MIRSFDFGLNLGGIWVELIHHELRNGNYLSAHEEEGALGFESKPLTMKIINIRFGYEN